MHADGPVSKFCPTIGCERPRTVICKLLFPEDWRTTVSACEKHIDFYVARATMRWVAGTQGQEGVVAHVDGHEWEPRLEAIKREIEKRRFLDMRGRCLTDTHEAVEWYGEKRCCK
jgi:hypothetical protein